MPAKLVAPLIPVVLLLGLSACAPRPRWEEPPPPRAPRPASPPPVDLAVSDVATGGSWQEGKRSGPLRVVVRSGGRNTMRSEVVLQWLRWDDRTDHPIEVRSVPIREVRRNGIIVTNARIEQDDGRPVVRLSLANAITGAVGEARVWPTRLGRYRVKIKWID